MSALKKTTKIRTQSMEDFYADIITPPRSSNPKLESEKVENETAPPTDSVNFESKREMKPQKVILAAMTISIGIVACILAVTLFILFGDSLFGK